MNVNQDLNKIVSPQKNDELPPTEETGTSTFIPLREGDVDTVTAPQTSQKLHHVDITDDLSNLVIKVFSTPERLQEQAQKQRKLEGVIHLMLVVGLVISTVLMLAGLGLDLVLHRDVPTAVPDILEVFARVASLRPSGFLVLGLLALIATPILRVVGSVLTFLYERDWRYAFYTFLVLMIVITSILLGKG